MCILYTLNITLVNYDSKRNTPKITFQKAYRHLCERALRAYRHFHYKIFLVEQQSFLYANESITNHVSAPFLGPFTVLNCQLMMSTETKRPLFYKKGLLVEMSICPQCSLQEKCLGVEREIIYVYKEEGTIHPDQYSILKLLSIYPYAVDCTCMLTCEITKFGHTILCCSHLISL